MYRWFILWVKASIRSNRHQEYAYMLGCSDVIIYTYHKDRSARFQALARYCVDRMKRKLRKAGLLQSKKTLVMESTSLETLNSLRKQVQYLEAEQARIQVYGVINPQPFSKQDFDTELFNLNFNATAWINEQLLQLIADKKKAIESIVLVNKQS